MSETNYPGTDYSGGLLNYDTETGIHYGVIPLHALSEWAHESFEDDYGEPTCPKCGNATWKYGEAVEMIEKGEVEGITSEDELTNYHDHSCADFVCTTCGIVLGSDESYGEEPIGSSVDDGKYKLWLASDGDVWVFKSPYFTRAQYCSPCAPGAGYLLNPCKDGPRVYCLGPDWFQDDKPPYPIYKVEDGSLVSEGSTDGEAATQ